MKKLFIYIAVNTCLTSFVFAQTAYLPFTRTLSKGGLDIEGSAESFITQQVADKDGETTALSSGFSNTRLDMDLVGKYGVTNQLELHGGLRYRYIQTTFSQDFTGSGTEDYQLTTSGLESFLIGGKYSFRQIGRVKYAVEGYYRHVTYTNKEFVAGEEPEVAFGEGSREYAAGGAIHYITKSKNYLEAKILYRSPAENLSHEIFSVFRYGIVWSKVSLFGGLENILSRGNDPYTSDEANKKRVFTGASAYFNSLNRQWTAPFIGVNFALGSKWRLSFKTAMVTSGRSTDLGQRFLVSIGRRAEKRSKEFSKRNKKFKQYRIEGVVKKLSKSRKVAVINKGKKNGLRKGMKVDFYYFDFVGGNELIAKGRVLKVKYSKAIVKIIKRYSKKRVKKGTVARAGIISK